SLAVFGFPCLPQCAHRGGLARAGRADQDVDGACGDSDRGQRCGLVLSQHLAVPVWPGRGFLLRCQWHVGVVVVRERCSSRSSAVRSCSEENTVECLGRKALDPSGLRNSTGLVASSGGVSLSDACSAASTTMPTTASRSWVVANR